MNSVDALSTSLYFSATANAAREAKKEQENAKTQKAKKTPFSSILEKTQEEEKLASLGLPPEIAGLDEEDAVVFLKDALDIAADKLEERASAENFAQFRKSVSQFFKYLEKTNFEVTKRKRLRTRIITKKSVYNTIQRKQDPYFQIKVINQRLDEMASMILLDHADKLSMLSKIGEIQGLIVDFFAV